MKLNEVATSFEKDPSTINAPAIETMADQLALLDKEGKKLRKTVLALLRTIAGAYQRHIDPDPRPWPWVQGQPTKTQRRLSRSGQIMKAGETLKEIDRYAYRKLNSGYASDLKNPRLVELLRIVAQGLA